MESKLFAAAAAAAMTLTMTAAGGAHATVMLATYTGTITSGAADNTSFGASGLIGQTYTAVFTYDSAEGTLSSFPVTPSISAYFSETLSGYGLASPVTALSLTIKGITRTYDYLVTVPSGGSTTTEVDRSSSPGAPFGDQRIDVAEGHYNADRVYDYNLVTAEFRSPTLISPDYAAGWAPDPNATFSSASFYHALGDGRSGYTEFYDLRANVTGVSVRPLAVATPAGVPEPQAWALSILGFGLSGVLLRRRRASLIA